MLLQVLSPLPGVGGWCREVGRRVSEDWDEASGAFSRVPGHLSPRHTDLPLPQMLPSLPPLPWNQQTGKSQWARSLQDPPQGTMLAPALAMGGHPNSRRLAPKPQAQRLQLHLMRPSGLGLIAKCHLLSESRLCWPQPRPPQVSVLCGQVDRALRTLTSQWLHALSLSPLVRLGRKWVLGGSS